MRIAQHNEKLGRIARVGITAAAGVALALCSQGASASASPADGGASGSQIVVGEPTPGCGIGSPEQAAQTAAENANPPFDDPAQATWDAANADTSGYDPCTGLSWIVLPVQGGTGSSPYAIALFHQDLYLGTATAEAYGFAPDITRLDDGTISVTYHYLLDGDSNADPSGTATAQFHYDVASGTVQMTGTVPPA